MFEACVLGGIAQAFGMAVVEEGVGAAGDAVDRVEACLGATKANLDECGEVSCARPHMQATFVGHGCVDVADADAKNV